MILTNQKEQELIQAFSVFTDEEIRWELRRRRALNPFHLAPKKPEIPVLKVYGEVVKVGRYNAGYTQVFVKIQEAPQEILDDLYDYEKKEGIQAHVSSRAGLNKDNMPQPGTKVLATVKQTESWKIWWRERIKIIKFITE